MQAWSVNQQATEDFKRIALEYMNDDELECFTGAVQSVITNTVTQASTSHNRTAISSTQSLDVFVRCSDGIERLCRPSDRVLVSVGHEVSVVNVKTKEGPYLLYLANHTTRHEYRPRYKGLSLLQMIGVACLVVGVPSWAVGKFLLPSAWVSAVVDSQFGNNVLFVVGGVLVFMVVRLMVQMVNETCQKVEKLVGEFSERAKSRELVQ